MPSQSLGTLRYAPYPRDSQRLRLYRAQDTVPSGQALPELEACQLYVDRVTSSEWWRLRYPHVTRVKVHWRLGRTAVASPMTNTISLPRSLRTERTNLHELAHLVTPQGVASHGPEYARTYLDIVAQFMGSDFAQELFQAFHTHRVRVAEPSSQEDRAGATNSTRADI
jgi:putative metallohydrolase (TIGR04338 family)